MRALYWILGLSAVANGIWMLWSPEAWYHELPAAIPDTGPLNLHFVRDIGAAFLTFGLGLCIGAEIQKYRRMAVTMAATFRATAMAVTRWVPRAATSDDRDGSPHHRGPR